jgi:hypothetical protein
MSEEYKSVHGCIPCNFVCDCCEFLCSRCCSGINMYVKGDPNKPKRILCESCYLNCLNNSTGCTMNR